MRVVLSVGKKRFKYSPSTQNKTIILLFKLRVVASNFILNISFHVKSYEEADHIISFSRNILKMLANCSVWPLHKSQFLLILSSFYNKFTRLFLRCYRPRKLTHNKKFLWQKPDLIFSQRLVTVTATWKSTIKSHFLWPTLAIVLYWNWFKCLLRLKHYINFISRELTIWWLSGPELNGFCWSF